jgi:hypothetical protein
MTCANCDSENSIGKLYGFLYVCKELGILRFVKINEENPQPTCFDCVQHLKNLTQNECFPGPRCHKIEMIEILDETMLQAAKEMEMMYNAAKDVIEWAGEMEKWLARI